MVSPAVGEGSSSPYEVRMRPGLLAVAMPGRPLKRVVAYRSRPTVMLNGGPDMTVSSGLHIVFQNAWIVPPKVSKLRTSVEAGPYSPAILYGFAGNVDSPSVLLIVLP